MTTATATEPRYLTSMITANGISVYFSGGDPLIVPSTSPMYDEIVERVNSGNKTGLYQIVNLAAKVKAHTKGKFTLVEHDGVEVVMLYNQPMPPALSELLLDFVEAKTPTEAIERFWQNCCKNPSEESRKALYGFIQANNMTLTDDGCFIGYRSVRDNFTDHRTGKFDNSVGSTVSMPRADVDPVAAHTCSAGLHVAAWEYAWNNFGGSRGTTIEVKVNPKDVVTVPPDYNQQKMRVCEFYVIRQVVTENSNLLHPDTFVDQEVEDDSAAPNTVAPNTVAPTKGDTYVLTVTSSGGLNVPANLAREAGFAVGDTAHYCYDEDEDAIIVTNKCCGQDDDCYSRVVDSHNSIRLGSKVVEELDGYGGDQVEAVFNRTDNRIEITLQ